ncbi:hypothetical protein CerSpe_143490 [Prunus speciosa]
MAKLALPGPVISFLLLFFFLGEISMLVNGQKAWCVAKPAAPQQALQSALDYACNYADCNPTKKGGSSYDPYRPAHHASFAMNAYYQKMGRNQRNCHFKKRLKESGCRRKCACNDIILLGSKGGASDTVLARNIGFKEESLGSRLKEQKNRTRPTLAPRSA